jgi:hypothetical protein
MNPIKTPQELLLEQAGIPHLAGGGGLAAGAKQLFETAVKRFKAVNGRAPNAGELAQLEHHATSFSAPTSTVTRPGMSTEARAFHELSTDPNLMFPEGPDPFLTQAMLGRTPKGTRLRPKPADINDPQVMANIEARQQAGTLTDEIVNPSSITPSADYLANMAKSIEDTALAGGSLDKLKLNFAQKHGRYPTEDELNALIADWNVVRHPYSEKGLSVVGERPPTAKGMAPWKQEAREAGIPESFINKPPSDYPAYLTDELMLQKGYVPAKKEGGQITPNQMAHEMLACGGAPQKFAGGGVSIPWPTTMQQMEQQTSVPATVQRIWDEQSKYEPTLVARTPGLTERTQDLVAKLSPKAAQRLFGTNEDANSVDKILRFVNPISAVTGTVDAFKEASEAAAQGDVPGAFGSYYGGLLGALPAGPAVKGTAGKILKKIKK